jgi:hypothetical protein
VCTRNGTAQSPDGSVFGLRGLGVSQSESEPVSGPPAATEELPLASVGTEVFAFEEVAGPVLACLEDRDTRELLKKWSVSCSTAAMHFGT